MTSLVSGRRQHAADTEERHVTGVAGKTVVLRCDLPTSNPPTVRWIDYVYNSGPAPELIYASGQVQRSHPNADEFRVDSEFNMTISSLRQDVSPGQYICQSDVGGRTHQLVYQLTVCSMPLCSGVTHVNAGDTTSLACESVYSGNEKPQLEWFRQVHRRHRVFDDQPRQTEGRYGYSVNSFDEFELRENVGLVARQVARVPSHQSDDGAVYTCQMTLTDMVLQCNLTLNVTYLVKDVKFRPRDNHVAVDDEIKCHARGNPTPEISINPRMTSEVDGSGWKSFRVPAEYRGTDLSVVCTATNTVDDASETVRKNRIFHVAERRPDKHGPVNPNEHPPMHDSSSADDAAEVKRQSTDPKNSGKTWRRVEQNFVFVTSLLSLVMLF